MKKVQISVLFADIKGYTSLSKKIDTVVLQKLLDEYLKEMSRIIENHRGNIDKVMGDGLMVLFGYPHRQQYHARNAVKAALAMQKKAELLRPKWQLVGGGTDLQMRTGIASGNVLLGDIEVKGYSEFRVIGETVNLAARLEAKIDPGKILISEETYQEISDEIDCQKIEDVELKGFDDAIVAYTVIGPAKIRKKTKSKKIRPKKSKSKQDQKDQRISPRRKLSLYVTYTMKGDKQQNKCLDISESGIFIESEKLVAVGSEIEIFARFPTDRGVVPVTIKGRVVRVSTDAKISGMGIEFMWIQANNADTIRYVIKEVYGLRQFESSHIRKKGPHFKYNLDSARGRITLKGKTLPLSVDRMGINNADYLTRRMEHEFRRTRRYGDEFSCVSISLINLHKINDLHAVCKLLNGISDILLNVVRDTDEVFFLNEMNFFILAPETMMDRIDTLIRRIVGPLNVFIQKQGREFSVVEIITGSFTFDGNNAATPEDIIHKTLAF